MKNKLWIIGCGDIGRRVVHLYNNPNNGLNNGPNNNERTERSVSLYALVNSKISKKRCDALGVNTFAVDLDNKRAIESLKITDSIENSKLFYFAPPPSIGIEDTRLKLFLSSLSRQPKRIVLISTTGVYGDSKGEWIDESSPINPQAERAQRRYFAEQTVQHWAEYYQTEYIILRVPGIYAKDRLPLARLKKGLAVVNQDEAGWTNRIHADDLARVCHYAMESSVSGEIYNVTDGHPSTMTDYFNQVADYVNLPHPPQISMQQAEATLSAGMVSYLKESRRISNKKMLDHFKLNLDYPSLQQGLPHNEKKSKRSL